MEKEYLERETLLRNAKKFQGELFGSVLIVSEIENMPAADVKEVIHAKWIKVTNRDSYWYACPCCGHEAPKDTWNQYWLSDWCPNCGANMCSKNEDDNFMR